jgi:hypothetical protein
VLTPAKLRSYVRNDVNPQNPPYGYVMAAAANISKAGYDVFREEARLPCDIAAKPRATSSSERVLK